MIRIIILIMGILMITIWYLFYYNINEDEIFISEISNDSLKSFDINILKTETNISSDSIPSLENITNINTTDYTTDIISDECSEKSFDPSIIY